MWIILQLFGQESIQTIDQFKDLVSWWHIKANIITKYPKKNINMSTKFHNNDNPSNSSWDVTLKITNV